MQRPKQERSRKYQFDIAEPLGHAEFPTSDECIMSGLPQDFLVENCEALVVRVPTFFKSKGGWSSCYQSWSIFSPPFWTLFKYTSLTRKPPIPPPAGLVKYNTSFTLYHNRCFTDLNQKKLRGSLIVFFKDHQPENQQTVWMIIFHQPLTKKNTPTTLLEASLTLKALEPPRAPDQGRLLTWPMAKGWLIVMTWGWEVC